MTNLYNIVALLNHAADTLAYPKLAIETPEGHSLILKLAGDKSKWPGSVTVTDNRRYPGNTFYGRISSAGDWHEGHANSFDANHVITFLAELAADTVEVIAAHGHRSGACSCCGRALSDKRSIEVGYGPICANNWGLPWGRAKADVESEKANAEYYGAPHEVSSLADLAAQIIDGPRSVPVDGELKRNHLAGLHHEQPNRGCARCALEADESFDDDEQVTLIGIGDQLFTRTAIDPSPTINLSTDIPADWSHRFIN